MSEKQATTQQPGAPVGRPFTFDRVVRILISVAIIAVVIWLIGLLKSVLLPFLVAWLIAYLLEPFVQYNKRLLRVNKRWLPIFMTLFECVLVMTAIGMFLVPTIINEMHQVANFVRSYSEMGSDIPFIPPTLHEYLRNNIDFENIYRQLTHQDIRTIFNAIASFIAGGYDVVLGIFNWFIVLLYVVFIMLDYERLLKGFRRMVPPKYRDIVFKIGNDVKTSMNHYFRGQALVAFCVGIMFCIGFCIIKLPMAIILGLFIGILNMVPYLQLISLIPTTLLCLVYSVEGGVDFWRIWWECMAVYVAVQCIQDLVLTPRIMGKAMGLNPAIILLSLSVWGTLLGFIGLIIALPLTTLLLAYYDLYIKSREDSENLMLQQCDTPPLEQKEGTKPE
ncbi:MAG: AI-2E family transporter [Muribaculaceae bacterium]|nr:AI-2E family transporter [Muribaculaceae bacterium]